MILLVNLVVIMLCKLKFNKKISKVCFSQSKQHEINNAFTKNRVSTLLGNLEKPGIFNNFNMLVVKFLTQKNLSHKFVIIKIFL